MPRTQTDTPRASRGTRYTVPLASGGNVTVTLSVNPFELTDADRAFVFGIVDKVTGYGKTNARKRTDTPTESQNEHDEQPSA